MIRRGQWLSFGRQFLERSSFRCIISPSLFSCFPPYSSLWFDQNLFKLAERERARQREREREKERERQKEKEEMFRWQYPGRTQPLRLHPVCSRPASHPRGFSHTGISLEDFCWAVLCSIEPRLLLPCEQGASERSERRNSLSIRRSVEFAEFHTTASSESSMLVFGTR